MLTTPPPLQFLVYAPDQLDEDCIQRRIATRSEHLEKAKQLIAKGIIKTGGALLSPEALLNTSDHKMVASMMIIETTSLEEARKVVEGDIYYTGDVWDRERIVILPFASPPL